MAKNIVMGGVGQPIVIVDAVVTNSPNTTSPKSGDPVLVGTLAGVAEADKDTSTGFTTVNFSCIAALVVKGKKSGGNAAISAGDPIYMQADGSLDGDTGGTAFGYAFGNDVNSSPVGTDTRSGQLVASGNTTTTIRVWVRK